MSDLFIGEMLVLVLLLPVFLRPFIRGLQRIAGIPLLPLLSLLLCAGILAGVGIPVSFAPVLILVLAGFLYNLPRLVNLFRGLPTDWYGFASSIINGFFLAFLSTAVAFAFVFAAEGPYLSVAPIERRVETVRVAPGVRGRFLFWGPGEASPYRAAPRGLVLYTGDMSVGAAGRPTAAVVLAENGYIVLAADFGSRFDFRNVLMASPPLRRFGILLGRILQEYPLLTDDAEIAEVHQLDFSRLVQAYPRFLPEGVGPTAGTPVFPLFLVVEGDSAAPILALRDFLRLPVSGTVCLVSEDEASALLSGTAGHWPEGGVVSASVSLIMKSGVERASLLVLSTGGKDRACPGELACDDVLAARLLGCGRDAGRKGAELAARRLAGWLALRGDYLSGEAPR